MTESMLADYRRWLFDKSKPKKVESLRQWLIRETEFLTTAAETIKGLGPLKDSRQQHHHMFRENKKWDQKRSRQKCPECKHPIWRCNQCESLDVKSRWISAKKNRLCYQCLGPNHLGNRCKKKGKCNINGCEETHHRLLQEEAVIQKAEDKNQPINERKSSTQTGESSVEGLVNTTEQFSTAMESQRVMVMAL